MLRFLRKGQRAMQRVWLGHRLQALGAGVTVSVHARLEGHRGIRIADGARVDHGAILRGNSAMPVSVDIGADSSIKDYAVINANGGHVRMGSRCWIGPHCLLYGNGGISIGDDVLIAGHTSINTVSHNCERCDVPISKQGTYVGPVVIENDVWIGLNCTILQGVRIGRGSIIGAGAVVTRDIAPFSVAVGTPARVVRSRLHEPAQAHVALERAS